MLEESPRFPMEHQSGSSACTQQIAQPGFQQIENKSSLEDLVTKLAEISTKHMQRTYKTLQVQGAAIKNLDIQMEQIAKLADRSIRYPWGKVGDVLIKVGKLIFPADFLVMDLEDDHNMPIIIGRPFLATSRILIDMEKDELIVRVEDAHEIFKLHNLPKETISPGGSQICC
ncbi:unnamed protein product [Fraxinus pennsylvanica]|uniref:Reverse transcriptase domain-containing protein n=1 Tax=Fraxinus pennsylvanica TaxID=56036 RepID=A0AAD1YNQ9_9LAMI|nr:unnamed protein product [Fraxinus pennsylvanica]